MMAVQIALLAAPLLMHVMAMHTHTYTSSRSAALQAHSMALTIAVDPTDVVDHVSDHMYGSGMETYNHCMYGGFWSNLLYDDSVEDAAKGPLTTVATRDSWFSAGGSCSVQTGGMNGAQSLLLGNKGSTAVNRGLVVAQSGQHDSNETAIHFVGSKLYEGYLFLQSEGKATVRIALLCTALGAIGDPSVWRTLGSADLTTAGGNATSGIPGLAQGWSMLNFTITSSADCLHGGNGNAAGQGLISISLKEGANVAVDKVMVEPGTWGREYFRAVLANSFDC
eukprot:COSAG02_NODE_2732_length_8141_cov_41.736011_2_plen_280_part_00